MHRRAVASTKKYTHWMYKRSRRAVICAFLHIYDNLTIQNEQSLKVRDICIMVGIWSLFELVLNPKLHSLYNVLLCFLWFPLKLVVGPELLDPQVGRHDLVTQVLKQFTFWTVWSSGKIHFLNRNDSTNRLVVVGCHELVMKDLKVVMQRLTGLISGSEIVTVDMA